MAFGIGNTTHNNNITTTSGTMTISVSANSVLLIDVVSVTANASGANSVVSITSSHLTFAKRSAQTRSDTQDAEQCRGERWWAFCPSALTNEVITVTMAKAPDLSLWTTCTLVTECTGVINPASPWDTNAAVPNLNQGQNSVSGTAAPGITTTSPKPVGLVFAYTAGLTVGAPTTPGTWTQDNTTSGASNTIPRMNIYHQVFSSAQSGASWTSTGTNTSDWNWMADAFAMTTIAKAFGTLVT